VNAQAAGKLLIVLGLLLVVTGLVLYFNRGLPLIGRLPGDVRVERPGFSFYFPITTSLVLSLVLSLILYLISRFK